MGQSGLFLTTKKIYIKIMNLVYKYFYGFYKNVISNFLKFGIDTYTLELKVRRQFKKRYE